MGYSKILVPLVGEWGIVCEPEIRAVLNEIRNNLISLFANRDT